MKTIRFLLVLLLAFWIYQSCNAQPNIRYSDFVILPFAPEGISVSLRINKGEPDKFKAENLTVKGDTVQVILLLLKTLEETQTRLYAAEDILSVINLGGEVVDWKYFHSAVREYQRIIDEQKIRKP